MASEITGPDLLTPAEVAAIFRCHPRTVVRWAKEGKLSFVRTLGGHRRFHRAEVQGLIDGSKTERTEDGES